MRKRRTRNHIIADLSVNHVERHALLCGYSIERTRHDYGVDLMLFTYNDEGEYENESVNIQLKATDNLTVLKDGQTISFPLLRSDLEFWLAEWMPVILIIYDAQTDTAYWNYLQAYFQQRSGFDLALIGETISIPIEKANIVDQDAIRLFARFKANILSQYPGVRHEHF